MKIKNSKIIGVLLTLVLLGSLTAGLAVPVAAQGPQNLWSTVSAVGDVGRQTAGNAPLTFGPGPMEKAIDGTLYAYCWDTPMGAVTSYLKKSPDGGHSWMGCSTVTDDLPNVPIVAIACSPEDANTLYVATTDDPATVPVEPERVYRSSDAGGTFSLLSTIPFVSGTEVITSLSVGYSGGTHWIVVGTNDAAPATYNGEVYMKSDLFGSLWNPQAMTAGFDVVTLAVSPNFTTEANPQVVAVITNLTNTFVTFQYGGGAWNSGSTADVELSYRPYAFPPPPAPPGTSFGDVQAADIAFPADYNSSYPTVDLLVAVDDSAPGLGVGGDLYRVYPGIAYDQDIAGANTATMLNTVAAAGSSGSCKVLTAGTGSANVWHSENDSLSWLFSLKNTAQTGFNTLKYICMDDDYFNNGIAQVATSTAGGWDEASVAGTADFGVSWTDYGLINTNISQIMNMEVSPNYGADNTMFLLTTGTGPQDSLWKYDGTFWTRVATALPTATPPMGAFVAATSSVQCSPNYTVDNAVFLADTAGNKIYRATDGGTWFLPQVGAPPAFAGGWQVIDSSHLVVGEFTVVAYTQNNGTTWIPSDPLPGPPNTVVTFALSADGSTLLGGGNNGSVYKSEDAGLTWSGAAPPFVGGLPGGSWLNVAFDPNDPMTIYAADSVGNGVYRLTFPGDTMWRRIDGLAIVNWPGPSTAGGAFNGNRLVPGLHVAPDGALYAADAFTAGGGGAGADTMTISNGGTLGIDAANITVATGSVMATATSDGTSLGANVGPFANVPIVASILPIAYPITLDDEDQITLTDSGAGTDVVTLTLATGTAANINATFSGAGTYAAAGAIGTLTFTAPGETCILAPNVDLPLGVTGTWASTGGTFFAITYDGDGDVIATPVNFSLFDTLGVITFVSTTTGTTGSWALVGGGPVAQTTGNGDLDESVSPAPGGGFALPDSAVTPATAAAANVVLRSINPGASVNSPRGVYFEPMATGFTGIVANTVGLWFVPGSNKLFVLESNWAAPGAPGSNVWVYDDSLSVPVSLADPPDGTDTGRTSTATLSWSALPDCPGYEIWVSPNELFSPVIIDDFSNTTSYQATGLEDGITYYWKVCSAASNATTPGRALSPWPEPFSFTTGLAAAEWNPFWDAENVAPAPGATGVPLSPAFQWNPADWATGYDFVLADNPDFAAPLAEVTVTAPVYLYSGSLNYSTTYYWKVRAIKGTTTASIWATGTFTTMDAPAPPAPVTTVPPPVVETTEITPAWIWAIVIIGAILVIAVIVLIVMTRRVP